MGEGPQEEAEGQRTGGSCVVDLQQERQGWWLQDRLAEAPAAAVCMCAALISCTICVCSLCCVLLTVLPLSLLCVSPLCQVAGLREVLSTEEDRELQELAREELKHVQQQVGLFSVVVVVIKWQFLLVCVTQQTCVVLRMLWSRC